MCIRDRVRATVEIPVESTEEEVKNIVHENANIQTQLEGKNVVKEIYVKNKIKDNEKYYLFFDEIQNVKDFEKVINSFRATLNVSIFITGSNSKVQMCIRDRWERNKKIFLF